MYSEVPEYVISGNLRIEDEAGGTAYKSRFKCGKEGRTFWLRSDEIASWVLTSEDGRWIRIDSAVRCGQVYTFFIDFDKPPPEASALWFHYLATHVMAREVLVDADAEKTDTTNETHRSTAP
jgi:hypothetical protein